jgi:signal transduction histidine kinase
MGDSVVEGTVRLGMAIQATGPSRAPDPDREIRRELARELHDEVVQELTAMLVDLENFKRQPFDHQGAVRQFDSIQGSLRTMLGGLRRLLYGLREEAAEEDFADTVRVFAVRLRQRTGIKVQVRVSRDWPDPIRRSAARHLYRIVQEATTNARLHGGASSVRICLKVVDSEAIITVQDDGRGLGGDGMQDGMGLLGMHERALLLGGSLTVEGQERGTCVRLVVPQSALRRDLEQEQQRVPGSHRQDRRQDQLDVTVADSGAQILVNPWPSGRVSGQANQALPNE